MGSCCSCLDAIRGGKYSTAESSTMEMTESSKVPPASKHGISRAMSAPTIQIQGCKISGCGLALGEIPIEQDAAYWEYHVQIPGQTNHARRRGTSTRAEKNGDGDDEEEDVDEEFHDVEMDGSDENDDDDNGQDSYALKFGVATRKDRSFYKSLENAEAEGDEASSLDDGTVLMRPVPKLHHGDVIGVAVQQSDLPMIQILLNGEPLTECTINRFRGTVFPAVYIPPGAGSGNGGGGGMRDRLEDEGLSVVAEFNEDQFKEMSPHARFGPLLVSRGII